MPDYSSRDQAGLVTFYVPLWKRNGISLELFDNYWRDVHGPVCARLPGQFQYWQLHVAHNVGGTFPAVPGVNSTSVDEEQFDGIAELTFKSVADRNTWFVAAGVLMDDEHNIFSKGIGYVTEPGNSKTYVDGILDGAPNGATGAVKFHVMVRQKDGVSVADFRNYLTNVFAANAIKSKHLLKLRVHLLEKPDLSRPDAAGVAHSEPESLLYQAAFEIGFCNHLEMEWFFASDEYKAATKDQAKFVKQVSPFLERDPYCFVYDSKMTIAGQRGSRTAGLIRDIGAVNQLKDDILDLICGKGVR